MIKEEIKVIIDSMNALNTAILRYAPSLFEAAVGLIGTKITKADNSLRKDVEKYFVLPASKHDLVVCHKTCSYSLAFNFKASVSYRSPDSVQNPNFCDYTHYSEECIYVGSIDTYGILTDVNKFNPDEYKNDYDLEYVRESLLKRNATKREYELAKIQCGPFSHLDLWYNY